MNSAGNDTSHLLGAVLAGGMATRFGSDKALAEWDGRSLLEHAVAALAVHCRDVVIIGRETGPASCLPDWPRAGMGPLGGLAGALRHARDMGHAGVLSCGVDSLGLPDDLVALLSPAPAYLSTQPVVGHWPVTALAALEDILTGPGSHAIRRFCECVGARSVDCPDPPANINFPTDLAKLRNR